MGVVLHWTQAVLNSWYVKTTGVRRGSKRAFSTPWKLGLRTKIFCKSWSQQLNSDWFVLQWQFISRYDTHTAQEPGSLFWCHAVVSSQFTHVRSSTCRGWLHNLRADCSTVGLYYVTAAWQQVFYCSLQVRIFGVLLHVTVESIHLGR